MSEVQRRVIETTLPLSPQNQIEFFKDKSILFRVDVGSSKLTPKQCLAVLSNMKIEAEIKDVSPELMKEYMTMSLVVPTTNLAKIYANIVTGYKLGVMFYPEVADFFTLDQYAQFIVDNHEMIEKHCALLRSIPLFLLINSQSFVSQESLDNIKDRVNHVEDRVPEVGLNISQLVALPNFLSNFFTEEELQCTLIAPYYDYYFDDYVYGGDRLIKFMASKEHQSDFAIQAMAIMKCLKDGTYEIAKQEDVNDQGQSIRQDEHSG